MGCSPTWSLSFDDAERQARRLEQPLLVVYKDAFDTKSAAVQDILLSPSIQPLLKNKVLVVLTTEYPPDRRIVAQYGVTRAPAVVLIHPDGTYNALTEVSTPEVLESFLDRSKPPGLTPSTHPQVSRTLDYAEWEGIYENAVARAQRQNRELLIVYKWWLSAESTDLLSTIQNRPDVARHFAPTVNCLLDYDYAPNREHMRRFGVTTYPAIVRVSRGGSYQVLSGPMNPQDITRFMSGTAPAGSAPN